MPLRGPRKPQKRLLSRTRRETLGEPVLEGWITTREAAALTGYTTAYIRQLAIRGRVEAQKVGRDWLISRESLLAYKRKMDALGPQKHNPWREDLGRRGRRRENDE